MPIYEDQFEVASLFFLKKMIIIGVVVLLERYI
jgi:hypothetical protein